VTQARAVVIGAGIGGLAVAAGLRLAGWHVTVCERAASLEPVGAGLALAPNGLRALDAIGAGDRLRALAVPQELGLRRPDGRWLVRSTTGRMISDRFGDPVILLPRVAVIDELTAHVPARLISLSTETVLVEQGGPAWPPRRANWRQTWWWRPTGSVPQPARRSSPLTQGSATRDLLPGAY
jgi:2-polyprenyl-6-methoxyphenol hydroxylase-like FAD-dependent oxidoreductase